MSRSVFKSEAGRQQILDRYRSLLARWPVANKQYTVSTLLGNTFVIESGSTDKPALLLLHGSVSNSFTWLGDVERLARDFHVFAVDLVGEPGLSAESRPDYASGDYALWLHDVAEALGLKTLSLLGLSLGGWMALEFATRYPQRVRSLALICPGGLGAQRMMLLPKAIFYALCGSWGRERMTRLINGGRPLESDEVRQAMDYTMDMHQHFYPRTARLPRFDPERLACLTMPVLVLFGDRDAILDGPASLQHARAHIMRCEAVELRNCGHLIINQGERIADFLLRSIE